MTDQTMRNVHLHANPKGIRQQFRARIRKGVQLLNTVKPEWWQQINLETLDMLRTRTCICGQLFGRYQNAKRRLQMTPANAQSYGFVPGVPDYALTGYRTQALLTRLWKQEIKDLKRKAAQA